MGWGQDITYTPSKGKDSSSFAAKLFYKESRKQTTPKFRSVLCTRFQCSDGWGRSDKKQGGLALSLGSAQLHDPGAQETWSLEESSTSSAKLSLKKHQKAISNWLKSTNSEHTPS